MKNNKGITLLALIITIIVLVILAGVALNTLFGNNGILNNSKYSTEQYTKSVEKEAIALAFADLKMKLYTDDNITEITAELLQQRLNDAGNNVEVTDGENGNFVITFKSTGNQYEVTSNGSIVGEEQTEVAQGNGNAETQDEEIIESVEETLLDLGCTGKEETITLQPGKYRLEVWGAQGGYAIDSTNAYGGYGGYSAGTITLQESTELFINVGKMGESAANASATSLGGYNGGGSSHGDGDTAWGAGGGATSIALKTGLLRELNNDVDKILIVAGGGGGGGKYGGANIGGHAGGYLGNNGNGSSPGYGGTQEQGGNGNSSNAKAGGFGYGGGTDSNRASGGGAGFYGGGTGFTSGSGAGGGSGYIGNNALINKHMIGYNVRVSEEESTYTIRVKNVSEEAIKDYAKKQDGHVRITKIISEPDTLSIRRIPIYTNQQLNKVGSGKKVYLVETGNFYRFETGKTYILQNDVTFYGDFSEIQELIDTNQIVLDENGYTLTTINSTDPEYFTYSTTATTATITGLSVEGQTFYNQGELESIIFPTLNPDGLPITEIGQRAFVSRTRIKSIKLLEGMTTINGWAFQGCNSLSDITLPSTLRTIKTYAFLDCTSIQEVSLPDEITRLEGGAFFQCSNLEKINVPKNLETATGDSGRGPFGGCNKLRTIVFPELINSIPGYLFQGSTGFTSIEIPNTVTSIGASAFEGCYKLTSITIPPLVTQIGERAFKGCTGLTSITIPEGITTISGWTFEGCNKISSVTLPSTLTTIKAYAFLNCTSILNLNLPDGIIRLEGGAFYQCTNMTKINIPSNLTTVTSDSGRGPFGGCSKLSTVEFPQSITTLYAYLFQNCTGLTSMEIPSTVTSIGTHCFEGCSNLSSIEIPNTVTSIGTHAFKSCTKLTEFAIPEGITTIGGWSFEGCSRLNDISLPSTLKTIGTYAFLNCTSIGEISLPSGVTRIEEGAFYQCTVLADVEFLGTRSEWNAITIGSRNEKLTSATVHCSDD